MELAKIYVSESCAQVISKKPIPAGLVGGYIDVVYAEDLWADLSKTVVFRSNITRDVVTDGRRVPVPTDVLAAGVRLWVGFFGVAGDKALPTFWASLGTVGEAADPSGDESTDPTLPVWAQILGKTAELEKKVEREYQPKGDYLESSQLQPAIDTALAQAKESGVFDGPPGKDGADGQPGEDGKDGQDGAPGKDGIDGQDGLPGKSAYEYAKDGGYTGTEEEFAAKLAEENQGGADWNAAEGEPGHVKNRTHWVDFEPVALAENITMSSGYQYSNVYYNAVKDSDIATVIYDGVTYVCPVTLVKDITEYGDESYFYIGNFRDEAPDYPFSFWGYIGNRFSMFTAENGDHVLSVYVRQEKAVHKLDKKFIPDDIDSAPADWNASEGEPGHVRNRTHWTESVMVNPVFDGDLTGKESIYFGPDFNDAYAVRITPQSVSVDELIGSTMVLNMGGTEQSVPITAEMAMDSMSVLGVSGAVVLQGTDPIMLSFPDETTVLGTYFPAGTWFMCIPGAFYVKSASCLQPGTFEYVHKIDMKYLPRSGTETTGTINTEPFLITNSESEDGSFDVGCDEVEYIFVDRKFDEQVKKGVVAVTFRFNPIGYGAAYTATINLIVEKTAHSGTGMVVTMLNGIFRAGRELVLARLEYGGSNNNGVNMVYLSLMPLRTNRTSDGFLTGEIYPSVVIRGSSGKYYYLSVNDSGELVTTELKKET